ncbi:MAG: DNA polymerase III subunit chi [Endozoicomonadaceae bacterium]|nr:DNA polymerase III subunit chi [Endozoicomonadaceae bacterium]MBE8233340.1 DNA polymerase III subunit chi [Endozoicomonadaceae bacterium]
MKKKAHAARVIFYLLKQSTAKVVVDLVCRLTEKTFKAEDWLYIQTISNTTLNILNKYLWSYREDSFIPHQIWAPGVIHTHKTPVILGLNPPAQINSNALLLLTGYVLPNPLDYDRILHVVTLEEARLQSARLAFKFYQKQGLKPQFFTI